jgi:hypothetical protein
LFLLLNELLVLLACLFLPFLDLTLPDLLRLLQFVLKFACLCCLFTDHLCQFVTH